MRQNLVFLEDLHRVVHLRILTFLSDEEDGAKTALTERLDDLEVVQAEFPRGATLLPIWVVVSFLDQDLILSSETIIIN